MAQKYERYVDVSVTLLSGFMIQVSLGTLTYQTGDPTGTGKGGQSIWGEPFEDEIRATFKVRCACTLCTYTYTV